MTEKLMVLEVEMVNQIAAIGRERLPNEACGLLLAMPVNGVQIVELPNRSKTPHDSFTMTGNDMLLALEAVFRGPVPEKIVEGLTAWHTHPGGNIGPSQADLKNKPAKLNNLVVTLVEGGPPVPTWF